MRKIKVEAEVPVDGDMGGESMEFWEQIFPIHPLKVGEYFNDLLEIPDAFRMAQNISSFFSQVWSTRLGKQADRISTMPRYIASRTLKESLKWKARLTKLGCPR